MSMHAERPHNSRAAAGEPTPDAGELLLDLHQKLVRLHASLDEVLTVDRATHLRLLHELRGLIDAIQTNERFRDADAEHTPPQWLASTRD